MSYSAVVIGASAGGIQAVDNLLLGLSPDFTLPLILTLHISANAEIDYSLIFPHSGSRKVSEASEKTNPVSGQVHVAPPGYHLLIEKDRSFSLSNDEVVNWARPSIDVLFESAAEAYGPELIAVVLSGANQDGARGLQAVRQRGGFAIVQSLESAASASMPKSALELAGADLVLPPIEIGRALSKLTKERPDDEP